MYIRGIYVVYRGISMDIHSFLKPDFDAGPCCWSHSKRTRVWVNKSVLFHQPPWQLRQGKRRPTKGARPLLPRPPPSPCPSLPSQRRVQMCRRSRRSRRPAVAVAVAVAAGAVAVAAGASIGGSCGGGCAGFFPGGVAFDDFWPSQGWG
jgi:hypothetical protein